MKKCFALLLSVLCIAVSCREKTELKIPTGAGYVEGMECDGLKVFLGVPYAKAPVGELRWKAPQPADPWEGVLETKRFGKDPMQPRLFSDMVFRGEGNSEDCLFLNIWTPATYTDEKLPVLIYFNGGGLMTGSGSEYRYDGASIAKKGIISVTANYREGIFGYFSHPELTAENAGQASANFGFLDQVAAINWVKDNIAAFGGDPEHITIAGESAGSFSVSLLMASPLSKGLISSAILSSGAEVLPYKPVSLAEAEENGKTLFKSKNIASFAQAKAMPAEQLQELCPPTEMPRVTLDGYFLSESADETFKKGQQAQVPLLAGWNSKETTPDWCFDKAGKPSLEACKSYLDANFGGKADKVLQAYGICTEADICSQNMVDLASDMFTAFCTWKLCDYHAVSSACPVFRYKYNHPRPLFVSGESANNGVFPDGAVHSADIEYAMGNLSTNECYAWQAEDFAISELFMSYYANFVKAGDPNGEGLPKWTAIKSKEGKVPVMQIDTESAEMEDPALEQRYRLMEELYLNNL